MEAEEKLNLLEQLIQSKGREVFVEECLNKQIQSIEHDILEITDNDKKYTQHDIERATRKITKHVRDRPNAMTENLKGYMTQEIE